MNTNDMAGKQPKAADPLNRILAPIRGRLKLATFIAAVGSMLSLVPLAGIAHIAKMVLDDDAKALQLHAPVQDGIWQVVFVSILCLFAGMTLVSVAELIAHKADNFITHHLRVTATRRLAQVPLGWFTSRASGEVKQAMQDDIGTLHDLTAHFYTTKGRTIGAMLISVIYLFAMDWRMAIVSILPFPLFFVIFALAMKAGEANMQTFVAGQARISNAVIEFVNGIPVVKAFGASGKAHGSYREAIDAFTQAFIGFTRPLVAAIANANAIVAPVAVLGLVLTFGTLFVHLGWIAPVEVLPFALVAPGISASMLLMGFITHGLRNATGAAERIQALLETPVLTQPEASQLQMPQSAEIRVHNLDYGYDTGSNVLSNLSFTLKPGTVTAIVGSSGAGKSTIARLLLRFFDPTHGHITLGGVDLRNIDTPELYQRIGFVLQEVRLIHASVRDNISLGRPSANQQEIEDAARAANIHARILELPRGYDSVIGEDAQLSGGEQQRVSIARAVLLDPPVLVLDEATAAADAENETAIQEALSRFAKGRTLLVIAHRLDTIMHADNIIVVENGSICEQGQHSDLLTQNGRYAQLWSMAGNQGTSSNREHEAVPTC